MNLITNKYRPIELYLILHKSRLQFIDMILLVLLELLAKNILQIEYFNLNGVIEAGNIKLGENFKGYKQEPIDQIFLHQFKKKPNTTFNFQYILLTALEMANSKNKVLRLALKSRTIQTSLKNPTFYALFGHIKLNKSGKRLSDQIERELHLVRQKLDGLTKNSMSNQTKILNLLRNRFYFLGNYKVIDLFGSESESILSKYNREDYNIKYEFSLEYYKRRLQLAHIELLKMEYRAKEYEIEMNGDGME